MINLIEILFNLIFEHYNHWAIFIRETSDSRSPINIVSGLALFKKRGRTLCAISVFFFLTLLIWTIGYNLRGFPESRAITYPCKCEGSQCSCCSGNLLENINLNFRQRICTNISYVPEDFEFDVRILFNDYTIYNRVVSGMVLSTIFYRVTLPQIL